MVRNTLILICVLLLTLEANKSSRKSSRVRNKSKSEKTVEESIEKSTPDAPGNSGPGNSGPGNSGPGNSGPGNSGPIYPESWKGPRFAAGPKPAQEKHDDPWNGPMSPKAIHANTGNEPPGNSNPNLPMSGSQLQSPQMERSMEGPAYDEQINMTVHETLPEPGLESPPEYIAMSNASFVESSPQVQEHLAYMEGKLQFYGAKLREKDAIMMKMKEDFKGGRMSDLAELSKLLEVVQMGESIFSGEDSKSWICGTIFDLGAQEAIAIVRSMDREKVKKQIDIFVEDPSVYIAEGEVELRSSISKHLYYSFIKTYCESRGIYPVQETGN